MSHHQTPLSPMSCFEPSVGKAGRPPDQPGPWSALEHTTVLWKHYCVHACAWRGSPGREGQLEGAGLHSGSVLTWNRLPPALSNAASRAVGKWAVWGKLKSAVCWCPSGANDCQSHEEGTAPFASPWPPCHPSLGSGFPRSFLAFALAPGRTLLVPHPCPLNTATLLRLLQMVVAPTLVASPASAPSSLTLRYLTSGHGLEAPTPLSPAGLFAL